jgi:hypothetical protein
MPLRIRLRGALVVVGAVVFGAGTAGVAQAAELRFEKLNHTYTDFVPPLEDVTEKGVRVRLRSPKQSLLLRDHRIRLEPAADGSFAGEVELDVQGKGTLIADIYIGVYTESVTEQVIVPPQTLKIPGRVRIRRVEGGYEIEPLELPPSISVAIQTPTINAILTLCDNASILSLGSIDCTGLDRALTRPAIPIPSDQRFTLQDSQINDDDRVELDQLLQSVPAAGR